MNFKIMKKRGKIGQMRHDKKVQQRLEHYKEKKFRVWADLPGRARPPKVGGVIPDIYARKKKKLFIEEIETPATKESDKKQQERLKKGTKKLGGEFSIKIAK